MMVLWQDVRFAGRMLLRSPGFAVMVVGILAVGMGGGLMIFSIFNELSLRPFPVPDQERLVDLDERAPQWNLEYTAMAYQDFHEWRRQNRTFDCMTVWSHSGWNLGLDDRAERVEGIQVTYDYFDVLHVRPVLGRRFVEEDDRPGAAPVAVLSVKLWQELYGEDPGVLGRSVRLDGKPHTIVGVLPAAIVFPVKADLWVPLAQDPMSSGGWYLRGMGRLKPGVSLATAQADIEHIHKGLIDKRPVNKTTSPRLTPLRVKYMGEHQRVTSLLLLAAGLVLVLACCNITGMMLARGMTRSRELAVRISLGAPRGRIIRQVLTETLLLCILGALLGTLLGRLGLGLLLRSLADYLAPWMTFAMDGRVLAFCTGVVGLATVLSGLVPALHAASGKDMESTLRATAARTTASASGRRSLNVLVAGEIALAMTLTVGAVLLLEAFHQVCRTGPGFRVDGVLTYRISLPAGQYGDGNTRQAFFESHLERVRTLPGVRAASLSDIGPLAGHNGNFFDVEGVERAPGEMNPVVLTQVMRPAVYLPCGPNPPHSMAAFIHTSGDPLAVVAMIRETLRSADSSLSVHEVQTMQDRVHRSLWVRRTYSWLIGVFAAVAAIMAVGGIYGIMSYSVSRRAQEMGIRLALGARGGDIVRHVLTQGGRLIGIGLGVGLIGALGMGQLLAGLLFGVSAMDVRALLGVFVLLLAVTLLACYVPARRAAKVDPMVALRYE